MSIVVIFMRHSRYHSEKGVVTAKRGDSGSLLRDILGAVLIWITSITVIFFLGWSM